MPGTQASRDSDRKVRNFRQNSVRSNIGATIAPNRGNLSGTACNPSPATGNYPGQTIRETAMIEIQENRKGNNANGRREFSSEEVPVRIRALIRTQK